MYDPACTSNYANYPLITFENQTNLALERCLSSTPLMKHFVNLGLALPRSFRCSACEQTRHPYLGSDEHSRIIASQFTVVSAS